MTAPLAPHITMKLLIFLAISMIPSCSKKESPSDAYLELSRIMKHPKQDEGKITGRFDLHTEPSETPSHRATIEAVWEHPYGTKVSHEVYRFSAFRKNGIWYYDRPISLVCDGEPITRYDISTDGSLAAFKFDFRR